MSSPLVKPPRVCVISYCRVTHFTLSEGKKHLLHFTYTRVGEAYIIVIPLLPAHVGLGRRRRRSGSQIVGTTAAACLADRETGLPW